MPPSRRLKCKLCSESFSDRTEWAKHLRVTHSDSSLVEDEASDDNDDNEDDNDDEIYEPPSAKRELPPRRRSTIKPKIEDETEPSFPCLECNMVFNTKRGLAAHNMHRHKDSKTPKASQRVTNDAPSTPTESVRPGRKPSVSFVEPPSTLTPQSTPAPVHSTPTASAIITNVAGLEQESEEPDEYEYSAEMVEEEPEPEVENYPCKYCKDRIFLTSFGLERHTKISHPENMEDALREIKRIQAEKQKKAEARKLVADSVVNGNNTSSVASFMGRRAMAPSAPDPDYVGASRTRSPAYYHQRDRYSVPAAHSMRRRYSTKVTVEKENEPNFPGAKTADTGEMIQMARQQRAAIVASASFTEPRVTGRHKRSLDAPKAKYQSCEICGILINTEHPKAMESHTKAHQKNQELRQELLRLYGPSWVDNVTCRECNLVFKDEEKLDQHRRNVHVRRRHFLCRFCGDVFRNMRDLNMHKERRHEAFEGHRRNLENSGGDFMQSPQAFRRPMPPQGGPNRNVNNYSAAHDGAVPPGDANVEEFSCRTVCEVCGLQMVRPSNLIRHMKQAHNRTNFTATVETRGMPPFKIDVFDGQFMWGCCDDVYDDRQAFINHRRLAHGPSYVGNPKECEHCGLSFKNNVSYINHLRTHRPRVCHICGESFGNTAADLSSYRVHMLKHRDQGYNIRFSQIEDELTQKENQDLWRAIEEEEADDESEDDYSIFSESGVESDADENSELDEEDDGTLLTSCTICDKKFACIYRFADHWSLHCKRSALVEGLNLKTKPFRYNENKSQYSCTDCHQRFKHRVTLAQHSLYCMKKRFGEIPKEDIAIVTSPLKSKMLGQSPTKSPAISPTQMPSKPSDFEKTSNDEGMAETNEDLANASRELEDSLDVGAKEKQNALPLYVEKAYVVEWDTNKVPPEHPYLCRTCDQPFGDFLSLIMHVKTHVTHPIYDDLDVLTSENRPPKPTIVNGGDTVPDVDQDHNMESVAEKDTENNEESVRACVIRIRTSGTVAPGKHHCSICSRRFADKDLLEEHVHLNHSMRKQFYCRLCGDKFWTSDGLNNHSKRHDANNFYCSVCDKKFISLETLNKHETVHELTNSLYQCEDCTQSFFGLQQLQRHFKEHHKGVVILTCPICARIHTDAETLRVHFETEHADSRSRCLICDKSFETPMQAQCHAKRVHLLNGPSENCTLCDKIFTDKHQLALHVWRHTTSKGFQCRLCDAASETDEGVREHLEKVHNIDWVDSRDLIIDNQTVFNQENEESGGLKTANKCFSCYVCSRRFASKVLVKTHVARVHGGKKKYACSLCGVKYSRMNRLNEHMAFRHNVMNEQKDANFAENLEEPPGEQAENFMEDVEEQPNQQEQTASFTQNVDEHEPQTEQFLYDFGTNEPMQL